MGGLGLSISLYGNSNSYNDFITSCIQVVTTTHVRLLQVYCEYRQQRGPGQFNPSYRKHSRLVCSCQMAFKYNPTPALFRCPNSKIYTSLHATLMKLICLHLWFCLVCSIADYGECLCVGKLSPLTLIRCMPLSCDIML